VALYPFVKPMKDMQHAPQACRWENWKLNGSLAGLDICWPIVAAAMDSGQCRRRDLSRLPSSDARCPLLRKVPPSASRAQELHTRTKARSPADISAPMIKESARTYVVVGHSETPARLHAERALTSPRKAEAAWAQT